MRYVRGLKFIKTGALLLIPVLASSILSRAEGGGSSAPGAATFKSKCALCHGADGTGNTPLGKQLQAANLRSKDVQKRTDAELQKVVHDGLNNMPPFGEQLSEDEIAQVVKYVRHMGKIAKK